MALEWGKYIFFFFFTLEVYFISTIFFFNQKFWKKNTTLFLVVKTNLAKSEDSDFLVVCFLEVKVGLWLAQSPLLFFHDEVVLLEMPSWNRQLLPVSKEFKLSRRQQYERPLPLSVFTSTCLLISRKLPWWPRSGKIHLFFRDVSVSWWLPGLGREISFTAMFQGYCTMHIKAGTEWSANSQ